MFQTIKSKKMKKVVRLLAMSFFTACAVTFFGCKKDSVLPTVITASLSDITETSVKARGDVTSGGGVEVTARGVCWSTSHGPDVSGNIASAGSGTGSFETDITGLTDNTLYYIRAFATNSLGTAYGAEITFTTTKLIVLATVSTIPLSGITVASAESGPVISNNGGADVSESGICWGTSANPTTANGKSTTGSIIGLSPSTTYYVRAYAINSAGTAYGDELSFTTPDLGPVIFNAGLTYGTVSDVDGNNYKTIQIGSQVWMAENLRTTKYNGGQDIGSLSDGESTHEGYGWYNDNTAFKSTYGALYNWYAVSDSRKLCPAGWHVPTSMEWSDLAISLGGLSIAGGKLKEEGTTHWLIPNSDGFNESGFSAIPGGAFTQQDGDGYGPLTFSNLGFDAFFWSSSTIAPDDYFASYVSLNYSMAGLGLGPQLGKNSALSVRCLQDSK
jgi:uncharacterized protein (TIGR02145 family)